jgi:hypothetical protein
MQTSRHPDPSSRAVTRQDHHQLQWLHTPCSPESASHFLAPFNTLPTFQTWPRPTSLVSTTSFSYVSSTSPSRCL